MKKVVVTFFAVSVFFASGSSVKAQETLPLTISPVKQEVTLGPSQNQTLQITVFNKGNVPISGRFNVSDFVVNDTEGVPTLVDASPYPKYSAKNWFSLSPDEIIIDPQKGYTASMNVQAPENAAPGGHYVAVYFEPTSVTQEGSSNVSVRIVSLVNIKVPGTIKEETMISFFKAPQFAEQSPIEVDFAISNTGDYHITPRGKLVLTNMFGATVDQMSLPSHNIFPGSTRNYKLSLGKGFLLGQMKIHLTAQYGERLRSLDKTQNVFVFPWRLFLILCLGLIILYYMVRSVMGSRTSYPRENSSRGQSLTDLRTLREKVRKRND